MPARFLPLVLGATLVWTAPAVARQDEPSAETKAIIKTAREYLKGKKVEDRIKGVGMLGELGGKARTARRDLCEAMLDKTPKVRVAAIDALKLVDQETAELALKIGVEMDFNSLAAVAELKEDGEPLTPLVLEYTRLVSAGQIKTRSANDPSPLSAEQGLPACVHTLSVIAPDDEVACKAVLSALSSKYPEVALTAARVSRDLKYGRLGVKQLSALAQKADTGTRLEAIRSLAAVADDANEKAVGKLLNDMRFDTNESVRKTIEAATEQLKAKFGK